MGKIIDRILEYLPWENNTGRLGSPLKYWGKAYIDSLYVNSFTHTSGGLLSKQTIIYNNSDTTITLTVSDLRVLLLVDNASAVAVNLPSVDSDDIGEWINIHKMGAGNLTIIGADSDTIADSAGGGNVANTTAGETFAMVALVLARSTAWRFRNTPLGHWRTT